MKVVCHKCGAEYETGMVKMGDGTFRAYYIYEQLPPCPCCGTTGCLGHRWRK